MLIYSTCWHFHTVSIIGSAISRNTKALIGSEVVLFKALADFNFNTVVSNLSEALFAHTYVILGVQNFILIAFGNSLTNSIYFNKSTPTKTSVSFKINILIRFALSNLNTSETNSGISIYADAFFCDECLIFAASRFASSLLKDFSILADMTDSTIKNSLKGLASRLIHATRRAFSALTINFSI